ncbi:transposase [Membranihabitans marinus]|uniref:transposase n=1 Tax=Membranihabitans marinus TaxID=1227546 RepID=UPI001F2CA425|nr:transposase [Membranihabitans marinus]
MNTQKGKLPPQLNSKGSEQTQSWLLPNHLGDLISEDHPARMINRFVDELDIRDIISTYKPGGRSCYHPRVLIKLLVYGFLNREYSSRVLERECREDVVYMWLCGMLQPDHVTISNFRSKKLKNRINTIFTQVIEQLYNSGYINLKTENVDGKKIESVAEKYSYIWEKNVLRYSGDIKQKIAKMLEDMEAHVVDKNGSGEKY